jgi:hypothetical protein
MAAGASRDKGSSDHQCAERISHPPSDLFRAASREDVANYVRMRQLQERRRDE